MARRRELRVAANELVVGAVVLDDTGPQFIEYADRTFARLRTQLGDLETATALLDEGWSNGYIYLADEVKS